MNAMFGALGVASSGMSTYKTWLDAIADNIANVNTVRSTAEEAYRSKYVVAQSVEGSGFGAQARIGKGTTVANVVENDPEGIITYAPDHPLADENGLVRMPNVDMGEQMTSMIIAQRAYQMNVTVFERARDSYLRALEIGK
ncbi:MAG: flagellar basal body rod protein FlgC [Actinobacteria bacterium]|nr:flagellar basal body rod protein FlgC [Actinomycetota bacterium]